MSRAAIDDDVSSSPNEVNRLRSKPKPSSTRRYLQSTDEYLEEDLVSNESNKATVLAMFAAIDAAQSMAPLDTFASDTYVAHFTTAPQLDRKGMKAFGGAFFAAAPGLKHRVDHVVAEGDYVAVRLVVIGRHTQPLPLPTGALPPSNRDFEMPVINMLRFDEGRVVEHWSVFDMLGFLQQLGAIPA
jgi:predicted ester cyclase